MDDSEQPQIYLVTPPEIDIARFPARLAAMLDAHPVACVRLSLATQDSDRIARAADACRAVAHDRDVALVIDSHVLLVEPLGLDGVHLRDGPRSVRAARKDLGEDAIVGTWCGSLRHDGLSAGEAGADYVAFGPVGQTGLGDGRAAAPDLFAWWSEMVELPVVAEGGLDAALMRDLAPITDFFALGEEVWRDDDPVATLGALIAAMG